MRAIIAIAGFFAGFALCAAHAADMAESLTGKWVWSVEGRPVVLLEVGAGADCAVSMTRPEIIRFTSTGTVREAAGEVKTRSLQAEPREGGALELSETGENGARFMLDPVDADRAELRILGTPFPPLPLYRPYAPTEVLTGWGGEREYGAGAPPAGSDNEELKAMFEADQSARLASEIDWSLLSEQDRARAARLRELLDAGAVQTAEDYWRAAYIFQHGEGPQDFLLAHVLATTAVAKGKADAAWIAAASLDRYLMNIGQPQIYGTQFTANPSGAPYTQGDYDRALVPDSMRRAAGVPTLAEQQVQLETYNADRPAAPDGP